MPHQIDPATLLRIQQMMRDRGVGARNVETLLPYATREPREMLVETLRSVVSPGRGPRPPVSVSPLPGGGRPPASPLELQKYGGGSQGAPLAGQPGLSDEERAQAYIRERLLPKRRLALENIFNLKNALRGYQGVPFMKDVEVNRLFPERITGGGGAQAPAAAPTPPTRQADEEDVYAGRQRPPSEVPLRPDVSRKPEPRTLEPSTLERLRAAQRRRGISEGLGRLGKWWTPAHIEYGIEPSGGFVDRPAREEIALLQQKLGLEELDPSSRPDSKISSFLRQEFGKYGMEVPEGTSARDIQQGAPQLFGLIAGELDAATDARAAAIKQQQKTFDVLRTERTRFLQSTERKNLVAAVRAADTIGDLLETNPMGQKGTLIMMAKATGDTGRLSDQDIQRWAERMGIDATFDAIRVWITGRFAPEHARQMSELARMLKKKNAEHLTQLADAEADSFLAASPDAKASGVTRELLLQAYGIPAFKSSVEERVIFQANDGKVYKMPRSEAEEDEAAGEGTIQGEAK